MANLLALTATAVDTNMKCSWTLAGSDFTSVTSIVLTYTDLSNNEWINVPVAVIGVGYYEEVVRDLTPGQVYKVYVTVFGKNGVANLLKLSEVKYVTAAAPAPLPTVSILSGPTYLQILFKNDDETPYDFTNTGILGFVVSCNNVSDNHNTTGSNPSGGQSAKDFTVAGVKNYIDFTATDGNVYTYHYVIMKDLAVTSDYEVAITYYDETGFRPIQNLTTYEAPAQTLPLGEAAFAAYALNEPVGDFTAVTAPTIIVNWRNPVVIIDDELADLPQRPLKIVREKKVGTSFVYDVSFNLDQTVDLATNFLNNGYARISLGNFTYTDTDATLVAGEEYQYTITMKEIDGTTETASTTNNTVVALITPTVALSAEYLILDVNDGSIRLDAAFTDIVTNDGGFSVSEFGNTDFKLAYKLGADANWSYEHISIDYDTERVSTAADIARRVAGQESVQFKIMAIPKHTTDYASYTDAEDYQDITSSRVSSVISNNYNTILPGAVEDFEYTNATATATAEASFTLTWSATDSKTNNNSVAFYRVVATRTATFTAIFSEATLSRKPAHDFSDIIAAVDGKLSYTFDETTDAFFTKGQDYSFTIQRIYLDDNTISRENADDADVGITEEGYLLGPVAGESHIPLRMFENPPTPVPSAYYFNEATGELSFTLDHALYPATHGFSNGDTTFKIMVTGPEGYSVSFDAVAQTLTKTHTVNMSTAVVGSTYTLTVMARNYAGFLGHNNGPSGATAFYSDPTDDFEFVKEGPVETSTSLISYNSDGSTARGKDLLVTWDAVSNDAADALEAPMYYILSVTNETTTADTYPDLYLKSPIATNAEMFIGAAPANLASFADASPRSYEYTVNNLGDEYSFKIKARYLSQQTGFAPKYITGGDAETANALQAVGDLPNPAVTMDVEHNTVNGDRVHLMMDLAGATNESGIAAADLKFVYATDKEVMTYMGAHVMEATILASAFNSLVKTQKIPISVYTFYRTHSSSEHIAEEDVEFLSSGVINTDENQFNPVLYTYAPQIKKVTLRYWGGGSNVHVSIVVTVEANDAQAPDEAVIITHTTAGSYVLTHDRDAQNTFVAVTGNDGDYTYAVPDVQTNGLMLFSFVCNNSKGLGVVRFALAGGLAAGTYVRDVRSTADLDSPFVWTSAEI